MILLLVLLGAVLIQFLAEFLYEKNWYRNLTVTIRFQEKPLTEGEEGYLIETIENRKILFLPVLQAAFGVSRNLNFGEEENTSVSDQSYKRDVFSVMSRQRIIRQVSFTAEKRGYYEIHKTELLTKRLLMSGTLYETCPCSTYLYVYPRKIQGPAWQSLFQKITGTLAARKRLLEDPFQFRGIREYTVQDPMNKINWKASAKTGSLMVNLQDSATSGNVYLLLDVEDETIWKYGEIHEEGIRLATSLAEVFLKKGIETGLMTNGRDCTSQNEIFLAAGAGKGQSTRIAQNLSRIDLSAKTRKFSDCLEEKKDLLFAGQSLCILITKNQYSHLTQIMAELAGKNDGSIFLLTLYEDMEMRIQGKGRMQVLRWEVKK